ncbi:MAG: NAD-dependent epimerase/dehydratase family protein [Myxococcota bacterium]
MGTTVVTGAAGFVGQGLVRRLHERGDEVVASDLQPSKAWPEGVRFERIDLRDADAVRRLCRGATAIFHSASVVHTRSTGIDALRAVNVDGTRHLLDAGETLGIRRFVYVSSASVVYEGQDIEGGDESMPYASRFGAPYARTKAEAEQLVLSRATDTLRTTAIRPHVVFGPEDTRFLPAVLTRAKAGKLKLGVGRRQNLSDFTYIDNLLDALLLADEALQADSPPASGEAYFVSNGTPMDFFEFIGRVLAELGLPPIRGRVPFAVAYGAAAVAERWQAWRGVTSGPEDGLSTFAVRYMCTHHYFSIRKAQRDLGYAPQVDLDEGIRRTCVALKAEGWA